MGREISARAERMFAVFAVILAVLACSEAGLVVREVEGPSVKLSVYYESLCGDSIRFITTQLFPAWQHFADDQTLQLDLVPFGKADFAANGPSWDFECQHGPEECRGNKVQACILDKVKDPQEYVPLITCLMDSQFPPDAAGECIADLGTDSITVKEVEDCVESDAGSALLYINGLRTKSLEPSLTFVPWLLYNDVYTDGSQAGGLDNLIKEICCNYLESGDKCEGYLDNC